MVSIEEIEDKIFWEKLEELYDSRDIKKLNRLDKEHKKYIEYTKKPLHPISYELEIERRNDPQYIEADNKLYERLNIWYLLMLGSMGVSLSIGAIFAILLLSALFGPV